MACITALPLGAAGGGHIHIKRGIYLVNTAINIPNTKTAITVTGECNSFDNEGTILDCNAAMDDMFLSYANFFYTKDIKYDGHSLTYQPLTINSIDGVVDHCSFTRGTETCLLTRSEKLWVKNCWIEGGGQRGLQIFRTGDVRVLNNIFWSNTSADITLDSWGGITDPKTIFISGNRFSTTDNCIHLWGQGGDISNIIIADNIFNNIGKTVSGYTFHNTVIYCDGVIHDVMIANNICQGDLTGTTYTDNFLTFKNGGTYTNFRLDNNIIRTINDTIIEGPAFATRLVQDNSGVNAGNPGAAGDWNGYGWEGLIIRDTAGAATYIYINGGWVAI
jgi:hypothetical protein